MKSGALALVIAFAAAPGLTASAGAQDSGAQAGLPRAPVSGDSALEARTTAIAATLRCPVCQGESVQDSPAELAQEMRALVREQLREGKTPDEIRGYFVDRYGEWILLEPRMNGLNILLYAFPVALVIGGLTLIVFVVRKWTTPESAAD